MIYLNIKKNAFNTPHALIGMPILQHFSFLWESENAIFPFLRESGIQKSLLGKSGETGNQKFWVFFYHQYAMRSSNMYISGLAQFLGFYLEV